LRQIQNTERAETVSKEAQGVLINSQEQIRANIKESENLCWESKNCQLSGNVKLTVDNG
jgi:hypothetical protein